MDVRGPNIKKYSSTPFIKCSKGYTFFQSQVLISPNSRRNSEESVRVRRSVFFAQVINQNQDWNWFWNFSVFRSRSTTLFDVWKIFWPSVTSLNGWILCLFMEKNTQIWNGLLVVSIFDVVWNRKIYSDMSSIRKKFTDSKRRTIRKLQRGKSQFFFFYLLARIENGDIDFEKFGFRNGTSMNANLENLIQYKLRRREAIV